MRTTAAGKSDGQLEAFKPQTDCTSFNLDSSLNSQIPNFANESFSSRETFQTSCAFSKTKTPVRSPLSTPLVKRLETLAVFLHGSSIIILPFIYFYLWCYPFMWPFLLIYTFKFYLFDRTPSNGNALNRYSKAMSNWSLYKHFANYYPVRLHRSKVLSPTKTPIKIELEQFDIPPFLVSITPEFVLSLLIKWKLIQKRTATVEKEMITGPRYIFGYHPHGVIAMGVLAGFATEGAGFSKLFPGIRCFVTTLVNQFQLPFYRDYLMSLGCTAVTKKNISSLLDQGHSVVIVVGGASESLLAKPHLNSIVLKRRKGFVKLALQASGKFGNDDICLVPVYAFGENNIYNVYYTNETEKANNKNDGYIRQVLKWFQLRLKKNFGFTLPIIVSRGLLNYDFGLLPHRRPIHIVTGAPIAVKRLHGKKYGDAVSPEEIDYYHSLYVQTLQELFANHKDEYLSEHDCDLNIVE
ncbi:hypothetical protein KL949_000768 [Ogataea haglerorum]|nr:hypothetical protein KL913_000772 [Ogataea haglerorum]KAG7721790.1 hypothetical protein KL949_000768 [Ogataea haglerorum]KAG7770119.1 hypothetical protein KL931_001883 [Ogataea haglerorum]